MIKVSPRYHNKVTDVILVPLILSKNFDPCSNNLILDFERFFIHLFFMYKFENATSFKTNTKNSGFFEYIKS